MATVSVAAGARLANPVHAMHARLNAAFGNTDAANDNPRTSTVSRSTKLLVASSAADREG